MKSYLMYQAFLAFGLLLGFQIGTGKNIDENTHMQNNQINMNPYLSGNYAAIQDIHVLIQQMVICGLLYALTPPFLTI